MLSEYAIIPDVFENSILSNRANMILLINLLEEICVNGFLADLYKGLWGKYLFGSKLTNIDNETRDKLMVLLNRLYDLKRIVKHPKRLTQPPDNDLMWLKLAMESHKINPFNGIVLTESTVTAYGEILDVFININKEISLDKWKTSSRSITLNKCVEDYRKYLEPLLRYARKIDLVDPYLNCKEGRYIESLKVFLELLGQREQKVELYIHVGEDEKSSTGEEGEVNANKYLDLWEERFRDLNKWHTIKFKTKIKTFIKVFIWKEINGKMKFHDRYILTDQYGIATPWGIDARYKNAKLENTTWSLLDEKDRSLRIEDYIENLSPYELLGEREINF